MAAGDYHTYEELQRLGEQIRDKAVQVSFEQESAQVVQQIHADHAYDPPVDGTGHVPADPPIAQDTIRSYAVRTYGGIPQLYTAFATPDPARAQPTIDSLWGVAFALTPGILADVLHTPLDNPVPADAWHPYTSVRDRIEDILNGRMRYWAGSAADSFDFAYLQPLSATVTPQGELAATLALTLTAHKRLREAVHNNIWQIGQDTLQVLDTLHHTRPYDTDVTLTVFTAAISVLLAVPTDGWSLVGGFGLAKALQGFADAASDVKKTIGGKTVNAVISTMVDAITALANGIDQQEQEIAAFLDKVGSQITPIGITAPQPTALTGLVRLGSAALPTQLYPSS